MRDFPSRTLLFLLLLAPLPLQAQSFTYYVQRSDLEDVRLGAAVWGDYDGDGDFDVVLTGVSASGPMARLYRFDGMESRELAPGSTAPVASYTVVQTFEALGWFSAGAWGDYDGDGDLDLVLLGGSSGTPPHGPRTVLYRNDDGHFEPVEAALPGLLAGTAVWVDYDNDGDLDLFLAGARDIEAEEYVSEIYRNDGGRFVRVESGLPGVFGGSASFADFDRDGDADLLLTGASRERFIAEVYRNDAGSFTAMGAGLPGVLFSSGSWGDFDADGFPDILLTGARLGPAVYDGIAGVFRNETGRFSRIDMDLGSAFYGGAVWGDYDNDGRLDILVMGNDQPFGKRVGRLYRLEGADFTYASNLPGTYRGTIVMADHDGDGDLDLLVVGDDATLGPRTTLYLNEHRVVNLPPEAPAAPEAAVEGRSVRFSWGGGFDRETPSAALTYNLRVGRTPGGSDVMPAMAHVADGRRLLAAPGNVGQNSAWTLRDLVPGTYFWSVQTIDQSYNGSAFAPEQTFTVGGISPLDTEVADEQPRFALHAAYPNPFVDLTTIELELPRPESVTLRIYNVIGEEIRTLVEGALPAGRRTIVWDGSDGAGRALPPGAYFYRLVAGRRSAAHSVLLVR